MILARCRSCGHDCVRQDWTEARQWVHVDEEIHLTTLTRNYDHDADPDIIDIAEASRQIL